MPTLSAPTTNVTVREGENVTLTCTPSVDSVIVVWEFFSGFGFFTKALQCIDEYCHTISITAASLFNEGYYICYVTGAKDLDNIEDIFIGIHLTVLESMYNIMVP